MKRYHGPGNQKLRSLLYSTARPDPLANHPPRCRDRLIQIIDTKLTKNFDSNFYRILNTLKDVTKNLGVLTEIFKKMLVFELIDQEAMFFSLFDQFCCTIYKKVKRRDFYESNNFDLALEMLLVISG